MLGIVISLVAAVLRKFMRGRHAGRYLEPKQSMILISATRLRPTYFVIL
jgi:hypothetical protein